MSFGPFPRFQPLTGRLPGGDVMDRGNVLLRLLAETAGHLLTASDGDALARGVFERIAPALELHAYFNFMVNDAGDALYLASCAGIPDEEARAISRLEFGQAVCGTVAMLRRPLVATSIQSSDDPKVQLVRGYGIRAYACNPLMAGNRLMGTLSFATRSRDRFAEDELEFFRTLAHYVAATEERRRMMAAMQQQAALLDLAQDAVIATDLDGAVQFWSRGAETLYGWGAAEARGRNYADLLATDLPRSFEGVRRALEQRPSWETELQQKRRDGLAVRVWSRWAARCGADGQQTGFLILEHDVGERSRMEAQIRQAQKLESLAVLAGGVAHDFNNLLTGIIGNAAFLEDQVGPPGSRGDAADPCRRHSNPTGADEPGDQRQRGHRAANPGDDRRPHRAGNGRRRCRYSAARPLCLAQRFGYGLRHGSRDRGQDLRPVLYHEGRRPRPGFVSRVGHHARLWRPHYGRQQAGAGNSVPPVVSSQWGGSTARQRTDARRRTLSRNPPVSC
ncbi:MAG: GAF domain-containing protein [Acidobacteriia bacterium]|nr:GAF domain-containing protein [Terriglobia bacterium]